MANKSGGFSSARNSTVLRFGAPDAVATRLRRGAMLDARAANGSLPPLGCLRLQPSRYRVLSPETKNHRQGIAGGFGGLASSRVKALLETKRQPDKSSAT